MLQSKHFINNFKVNTIKLKMGQSESHNAIAFFNNPQLFGNIKGGVMFFGKPEGHTEVKIRLSGFQPHSIHAIHIHEYGDISKGCKSTGCSF